jgi:hypothetical protein
VRDVSLLHSLKISFGPFASGALSQEVKLPRRDADYSSPADVKLSLLLQGFMAIG